MINDPGNDQEYDDESGEYEEYDESQEGEVEVEQPDSEGTWLDRLPDELRDAPFIGKAKDAREALIQLQNASNVMGNSLRIPGEDAGQEDWDKFYQRIIEKVPGIMPTPDTEDEEAMNAVYSILGTPASPDDYEYDEESDNSGMDVDFFRQVAHDAKLTQQQFDYILAAASASNEINAEQMEYNQAEVMSELKKEWGLATDQNIGTIVNFLKLTDAPPAVIEAAVDKQLSKDDYMWLNSIASSLKSTNDLLNLPASNQTVLTPMEARSQIQEMLNNHEHAYWNASDPNHKAAINKMVELQRAANAS